MLKIATLFGIGYLPKAPGTWGSVFATLCAYLLMAMGREGVLLFGLILFASFFIGWRATSQVQKSQAVHDPSFIVIDEFVGQWIALIPAIYAVATMGLVLWPAFLAGFLLFRLFDITKPLIIGWADRRHDALGVMLDDVFAGIFAAISVVILAGIYHGLF